MEARPERRRRRSSWPGNRFPRCLGTRKRTVNLELSDEREERIFRTIDSERKGLPASRRQLIDGYRGRVSYRARVCVLLDRP